jgi:hypothetical protein
MEDRFYDRPMIEVPQTHNREPLRLMATKAEPCTVLCFPGGISKPVRTGMTLTSERGVKEQRLSNFSDSARHSLRRDTYHILCALGGRPRLLAEPFDIMQCNPGDSVDGAPDGGARRRGIPRLTTDTVRGRVSEASDQERALSAAHGEARHGSRPTDPVLYMANHGKQHTCPLSTVYGILPLPNILSCGTGQPLAAGRDIGFRSRLSLLGLLGVEASLAVGPPEQISAGQLAGPQPRIGCHM